MRTKDARRTIFCPLENVYRWVKSMRREKQPKSVRPGPQGGDREEGVVCPIFLQNNIDFFGKSVLMGRAAERIYGPRVRKVER